MEGYEEMRARKFIAILVALSMLALLLVGCGKKEEPKAEEPKKEPVALKVWTHLTDAERGELQKIVDEWNAATGNEAIVEPSQGGFQEFAAATQAGAGPDLMYGIPHDNLGSFWKAGLLAEVPSGIVNKDDYLPVTIDAVSYDGKMFGVPIAMEAIALFYNNTLVPEPPKDWASFLEAAKKNGFMFDVKNPYFNFGFIAGMGGYVFKSTGGGLDVNDIGLNSEGAVQGLQLVKDLFTTYKLMPKDVDYEIPKGKFQAGKSAFWLTGPWEVSGMTDAKVPFAIAPMPTLPNGQPFKPFVGVQSAFVAKDSKNQEAAWDLIKHLQSKVDDFVIKGGFRIPVTKTGIARDDFKSNKISFGFAESAKNGIPMPNVPEMQAVWGPFAQMMTLIAEGRVQPKEAADTAVQQIKDGIKNLK